MRANSIDCQVHGPPEALPQMGRVAARPDQQRFTHERCYGGLVLLWMRRLALGAILLGLFGTYARADSPEKTSVDLVDSEASPLCRAHGTRVVIQTTRHLLTLCDAGTVHATYRVAFGSKGFGKTTEGDRKTPLGRYTLDTPRPSQAYHLFIPIGYPTEEQRARGYTGGAIGIHGPRRKVARRSSPGRISDWTQGCIAVWSDREIEAIAQWVAARLPLEVVIE